MMTRVGEIKRVAAVCTGLVLLLLACLAWVAGCGKEEKMSIPNLPPETYLSIADSVRNVTTYAQTLRWWGEDRDGEVAAYEYRWFTDPLEPGCQMDTNWVRTEETSKTFDLPVSNGRSVHRFEVRAVDNDGAMDESPCRLTLPVKNSPPTVMISNPAALPDTTFASIRAEWHGTDPEGDNTIAKYLVWLDGSRQDAKTVTPPDTTVFLGREDFDSRYERPRTLNVIAIDSGCDTSNVAARTWYVKEPRGRVLVVDDLGSDAGAAEMNTDRFYRTGLDTCGEVYSVLDVENYGGALLAQNLDSLFSIFDLVIWYNEPIRSAYPLANPHLTVGEANLKTYVEGGGSILIASLGALGSGGALRDSLWPDVFGVDSIFVRNGSSSFDCKNWVIQSDLAPGPDSLKVAGIWPGVECMLPAAGATPLYYIRPGTAGSFQTEAYYIGILNSWQAGKAALLAFPLSRSDQYGNARREYCKVVHSLLN